MTFAAIVTNSGLVAFTGTFTIDYTWPERIWIFVGMTTGVVITKLFIEISVPDVSKEVEIQLQRQDFVREKLIEGLGDEDDSELDQIKQANTQYTIRITDDDPL
jgi:hypothetical protein